MPTSPFRPEPRGLVPVSRRQTLGEEIANSISHGVGLAAALAGTPVLIVTAVRQNNTAMVVGGGIFCGAMILMYFSSMLYHALPKGRGKHLFRIFDHAAIFVLTGTCCHFFAVLTSV